MQRTLWVVVVCLMTLRGGVAQQQEQFREWQFQVPQGWGFAVQGETAVLTPQSAPEGSVYIRLFPGKTLVGNLQQWLEQSATEDTQNEKGTTVVQSRPMLVFPAGRPGVLEKVLQVKTSRGRDAARVYLGEDAGDHRGQMALFYGELPVSQAYTAAMNTFIHSVRYGNAPTIPAESPHVVRPQITQPEALTAPAMTAEGECALCNGWWVRFMPRPMAGPNFTFTMRPAWEYYRFFPDGWVYTSFPTRGDMDSLTCPQAGVGEDKCERYAIQGQMITIGREKAKTLERISATEIKLGGVATWLLRPIQGGLSGTYEAVSGGGGLGTAAIAISEMTFYPNGTFSTARTSGVNSTTSGSSASAYRNNSGGGRYSINGYNLQMQFSTGQTVTTKILAPSDNDKELLVIGNSTYTKKDGR